MDRRLLNPAKGLLALLAALATLPLPPAALVCFVGNPFPHTLPDWGQITDSLGRTGVSDDTIIKVLALLAWLIWAQLAVAVLTELVAITARRPSLALPLLPGIQPMAGRLVAAVMLLAAPSVPLRPAVTTPLLIETTSAHGVSAAVDDPLPIATAASPPVAMRNDAAASTTREYIVQRHDSFWSIAEDALGNGLRWREIRDLNIAQPQPDGGTVRTDSELVRPGWRLRIPVTATTGSPTPSAAAGEQNIEHRVERGEHLWAIAEETLTDHLGRKVTDTEVDPYWRQMIELNRDRLADPKDPSVIFVGQEILLPPLVALSDDPEDVDTSGASTPPAPLPLPSDEVSPIPESSAVTMDTRAPSSATNPPVNSTTSTSPSTSTTTVSKQPAHRSDRSQPPQDSVDPDVVDPDSENDGVPVTAGLLGVAGTVLAAGISLVVARRRRARMTEAAVGSRIPALPADLDDLRTEVHLRADTEAVAELRTALTEIATHIAAQPKKERRRRPRLVQLGSERIEVLLDEATLPAPQGWTPEASGAVWTRERPLVTVGDPAPTMAALVTIGRPDSDTEVLFDLEAAGLTTITGDDPTAAHDLVRSIVLELINSPLSDTIEIAIVDNVVDLEHDRVRHVESWDEIADDALAWAQLSRDALSAHRFDNVFAARGSGRLMDGLVPLIVVMNGPPEDASFARFCDLVLGGVASCAIVIAAEPSARGTNLIIEDAMVHVPALGLTCELQRVDEKTEDRIECLVMAADAPAQQATLFNEPPPTGPSSNGTYDDPAWEVLVRVLGEMTVTGGHKPLTPKQLGLMTYLALHTDASADRLEEALWPDPMASRRRRLHNTVSQVRAALGPEHIPASGDGNYRAGPKVRTDLDLLKRRVAYASGQPATLAIAILRGALELVDGPVFSYRNADRGSFVWVDLEHWVAETEAKVVEVAWKLWQLCTDAEDIDGAIWAARQGLLASPANTELTEALMRAYFASGDRSSAEQVYDSHVKALDRLDLDEVPATTLDLREEMDSVRLT